LKTYRYSLLCTLFLLTIIAFQALSAPFEEKKPRYEKAVLVPKGARPALKEEYPRRQLVVDRIKARHSQVLIIPFARSWNTAAFTATTGTEVEETPEIERDDFELGFALHSQRLRVGAQRNKEYFQRETQGFPEGWYRPLELLEYVDRPRGYTDTTFVHLAAKRIRRNYKVYRDFSDRIYGILNVVMTQNKQLTLMARRDMRSFRAEGTGLQPQVRNTASIHHKSPGEGTNMLEISGGSVWSTLTDSVGRDFRYITGFSDAAWGRNLRPDLNLDLKAKLQISTLRDKVYSFENTGKLESRTLETRKSGLLEVFTTILPSESVRLKAHVSGLYDSEHKGYLMPGVELALTPRVFQASVGFQRRAILPDHDELYWKSKFVKVNEKLQPEDYWEAYASLNVNLIARLILMAEASYSRPEGRVTWEQLSDHVWQPSNVETSEAILGQASITLNLIGALNTFAGIKYQYFDNQLYDPEIAADAGISYGNSAGGSITLGASYWDYQPLELSEPREDVVLAYGRINKTLFKALTIFIDGRYTFKSEDVLYYRGMPQAGRIVSVGANIVFGGLD